MSPIEQTKHFVRMVAESHGTDPEIADRHDAEIAELMHPVPVAPGGFLRPTPMMRARSFFEIYEALLAIEAGAG